MWCWVEEKSVIEELGIHHFVEVAHDLVVVVNAQVAHPRLCRGDTGNLMYW